jgi:hypothetical protein
VVAGKPLPARARAGSTPGQQISSETFLIALFQHPLGLHLPQVRGRADAASQQSEVDMDGQEELAAEAPLVVAEGEPAGGERGGFVRDRTRRFPGRRNALKVLYDDLEVASVRAAAQLAGLTPTGFVAAAGLTWAGPGLPPASSSDRALLAELLQGRTALRRYGVNLNQAVAALNSGGGAPVWLLQAVSGCARASERIDEATVVLTRRLT